MLRKSFHVNTGFCGFFKAGNALYYINFIILYRARLEGAQALHFSFCISGISFAEVAI
jgi:hypothetical protein